MKFSTYFLVILFATSVLVAGPVVLYSNGPINGDSSAYQISGASASVTDSFTLASPSVVMTVTFGEWVKTVASPPEEVEWEIGSSAFGSDLGSGTVALNPALFCSSGETCAIGFNVYSSSFSLDVPLNAGTFWLTLLNATDAANVPAENDYWDQNNGPSLAQDFFDGGSLGPVGSESFQIDGTTIPEPTSFALAAIGLILLAGIGRVANN